MSDARLRELIDRAFAYRGYVTVALRDGTQRVGFVYDRGSTHVEMFDETAEQRERLAIGEIIDIVLSGEDSAARAQERWERRQGELESRATSAWGEWEEAPTLILVALPIELRAVARAFGTRVRGGTVRGWLGGRVIARALGVGGSATPVIAAERPRFVISCGLAGSLHPTLGVGHVVLASSVCDETGDSVVARCTVLDTTRQALDGLGPVAIGEVLCATRVAATHDEKRALARPGRVAVDLESYSAARAAQRAGVPWLAVRVVLDPLDMDLPAFIRDAGEGSFVPVLKHALRPRGALELLRLRQRASSALRVLEQVLYRLAPALEQLGAAEARA